MKRDVCLDQRYDGICKGAGLGIRRSLDPLEWLGHSADVCAARDVARDARPGESLDENARATVRESRYLKNASENAGAMEVSSSGLLRLAFLLRDEENELVAFDCRIDRGE